MNLLVENRNGALPLKAQCSARIEAMIAYLRSSICDQNRRLERFHAVYLDAAQSYLGDAPMGMGCAGSLSVRMREVIGRAITLDAQKIIIAHNHPSGKCRPSHFDIDATARLQRVANALDIELLDHLIITESSAYSMRAGGYL